jgi:hypothetical protein
MSKRILLPVVLALILRLSVQAQFYTGMNSSSFGGVTNVNFNPAIADAPFIVDINLISMGLALNNNYIGVDRQTLLHPSNQR